MGIDLFPEKYKMDFIVKFKFYLNQINMKRLIKYLLPNKIYHFWVALKQYKRDINRYILHSNAFDSYSTQAKLEGFMSMLYHVIEKGLTMPETKMGFGKKVIYDLLYYLDLYDNRNYDRNSLAYTQSISVLKEYVEFHKNQNYILENELLERVYSKQRYLPKDFIFQEQLSIDKNQYFSKHDSDFLQFSKSRRSIRHFSENPVKLSDLIECIEIANSSPSLCNRQPTRVKIVTAPELIEKSLNLQNGNRGFGHLTNALLIITSDLTVFQDLNERNEPFLNGGLFSMTLLYALHYKKIGACMLNWSANQERDTSLRNLIKIPDNESVLTMIACGYPPENFKIASSPRFDTTKIYKIINV